MSTKELKARGVEMLIPMGEAYKLQVEYERLLAQKGEVEEVGLQLREKLKLEGREGRGLGDEPGTLYQEGGQMVKRQWLGQEMIFSSCGSTNVYGTGWV